MQSWTDVEILNVDGTEVDTYTRIRLCHDMKKSRSLPHGYEVNAQPDEIDYSGMPEA